MKPMLRFFAFWNRKNLAHGLFLFFIFTVASKGFSGSKLPFPFASHETSVFDSFSDITFAPKVIRDVSPAVFQLGGGTAFFVAFDGQTYIVTNNHIAGPANCPVSGCYMDAVFNLEKNRIAQKKILFLTPVATDQDVDVSFFRFKEAFEDGSFKALKVPASLEFDSPSQPRGLLKKNIYVLGHPRLGLKKISSGNIIRLERGHIIVSAYTLPGNSGSPIITEQGKVMGIHHSSVKRNDNVTKSSVLHEGKGSSVFSLLSVLKKGISDPSGVASDFIRIDQKISYSKAKKLAPLFLNAHVVPVLDTDKSFFGELYLECKNSLNLSAHSSSAFSLSHEACTTARQWIGCQSLENLPSPSFTLSTAKSMEHPDFMASGSWCPASETRKDWAQIFQKIGQKYESFVGGSALPWTADAVFQSFTDRERGMKVSFLETKQRLESRNEPIRFDDVLALLRYSEYEKKPEIKNMTLLEMVRQYKRLYNYQYEILEIGESVILLVKQGRLDRVEAKALVATLLDDEQISLNAFLILERKAFENNLI